MPHDPIRRPMYRMVLLTGFGLLAACGPLVQIGGNAPAPDRLLTLTATPATHVPSGLTPIDMPSALTVDLPTVPGALQTLRIPVTVSDTSIQYLTGAQWAEQPNRLFQRLLADKLGSQGIAIIDQRSSGQIGGQRLTGQLLAFGADTRNTAQAIVRYDATVSGPKGVRQRRFERSLPLHQVSQADVSVALNQLSNEIADDIALWIKNSA